MFFAYPCLLELFPLGEKIQIGVLFSIYQHMIILALGLYSYVGFPQYKEEKTVFLREIVMVIQNDIHCLHKKKKYKK